MIDLSPADFMKLHGGLLRVLRAIEEAGPAAGLSTRKVSEQVFNWRPCGWKILKQGAEIGYIECKDVRRTDKRGNPYYTMNYLTEKGRKLLQELGGE